MKFPSSLLIRTHDMQNLFGIVNKAEGKPQREPPTHLVSSNPIPIVSNNIEFQTTPHLAGSDFLLANKYHQIARNDLNPNSYSSSPQHQPPLPPPSCDLPPATLAHCQQRAFGSSADWATCCHHYSDRNPTPSRKSKGSAAFLA